MNYQQRQQSKKRPAKARWPIVVGVAAALLLGGGIWAMTHHHKAVETGTPVNNTTASPNTKGEPAAGIPAPQEGGDKSGGSTGATSPAPGSTATLTAPQGNFVSNHHPNLGGTPAPNSEQSVCNTTPGAICEIIFTKDGVTKSLQPQTADSGGAAYWSWKLQDVGLTAGSWHVSAQSTLGSQNKTADDAITLEVAP
ncbi:MAG TPA: hypothetical protein VLF71_00835 [Candidatus Saccharimonadales bacterium]|nr:hypothetical protein [Candidatus Saccharimonadales bacterium]